MNTVDALNALGKALCGDSFEVKPGLTDAETILEIAKNYEGGSGSGSGGGSGRRVIYLEDLPRSADLNATWDYEKGLALSDLIGAVIVTTGRQDEPESITEGHVIYRGDRAYNEHENIHYYVLDAFSSNLALAVPTETYRYVYFPETGGLDVSIPD